MSQQELLRSLVRLLNNKNYPYMLTGSVVSSIQGEPRLSHDIDIIIAPDFSIGKILGEYFASEDFYLDQESVKEAIRSNGMFNMIESASGDKIDFWLLTDSAFDESRFQRRKKILLFGESVWISSPEDTIIAKLFWAKKSGGSEKQMLDALRVYEVNSASVDCTYIEKWSLLLGCKDLWEGIKYQKG